MKRFILTVFLCSLLFYGFSQDPGKKAREKIEAAKIALITQRLELSPKQAERFWPIYREFSQKTRDIRRNYRQQRKSFNPNTATEAENRRMLDMGNRVKQNQLNLEKEYSQRMLKVISSRQLNNLRKAEGDFREMLINRLKEQQMKRQQRTRNSDLRKNRKN